jgi:hypothetical protein
LLFFMMGTVVQLVGSGGLADDPIVGALLDVLALLMVSLAPLTLRKYAPVIPGGGDATATGASGAMVGGAADLGGTVSQQQLAKAQMSALSGSGASGSGAASSQARIGSTRATSAPNGSSGTSLIPTAAPSGAGGQVTNSPLRNYLSMSGPGGGTGAAAQVGAGAGAGAGGAAGAAALGGAAAVAAPLALAATGVKAAKNFVESAAPNIGGSE